MATVNGGPSRRTRTIAAFLILVVWLGIVVYDVLTPEYEMPLPLWGLGIGDVSYLIGVNIPNLMGRRNGGTG